MVESLSRREQPLQSVSHTEWSIIREQAQTLVQTGFLPAAIKNAEQAVAIILTGRELGIPTMAALRSIDVIQGKPTVSPQLMLALINRSGQLEDLKIEHGANGVTVTMKRKGRAPHRATFGKDEAQALGLFSKDNYKKQAQTMYQWRAVAACARAVFPDVILGLYTHDEMGASVDAESGEMMDPPATVRQLAAVPEREEAAEAEEDTEAQKASEIRRTLEVEIMSILEKMPKVKSPQRTLAAWILKSYDTPDGFDGLFLTLGHDKYIHELSRMRDQFTMELEAMMTEGRPAQG